MSECCDQCRQPDGSCAYPHYGVAPHDCGGFDKIGTARALPRSQWPKNFIEDPECPSTEGKYPGCGVYFCPNEKCQHGADFELLMEVPTTRASRRDR